VAELYVIRHAQASFGAANYDVLSELGHRQSFALGRALAAQGISSADAWIMGEQRRHRETLEGAAKGMGVEADPIIHAGLNEFDFKELLAARYRHTPEPEGMHTDRKSHFRTLRETVLAWQRDEVIDPPETFAAFEARVQAALDHARGLDVERVMLFSSGGAISQMIRAVLGAPGPQQIELQLQMRNCAVNRFVAGKNSVFLAGYNETPHINAETSAEMLTYS
jgi:broad specificity phosphatase PhoE